MSVKLAAGVAASTAFMLSLAVPREAAAAPSNEACEARANDTAAKLVECIQNDALWKHLVDFQRIATQNPGSERHGNRDTGQPGYEASVDYVASLMRHAGYRVTIQSYPYAGFDIVGAPAFTTTGHSYALGPDWAVARLSASGTVTAPVQPLAPALGSDVAARTGCSTADFAGFMPGHVALLERGSCRYDIAVTNAQAAHAAGIILYDGTSGLDHTRIPQAKLAVAASIPVISVSRAIGLDLRQRTLAGHNPTVHLDIHTNLRAEQSDYNLIADSPFGDPNHVVVVDAHLDSIFGAGILDNASGSATILETALKMAKTPTRNQLRYIWFGGEEIGLLGSAYYTKNLSRKDLSRIVFDIDSDVTATPNFTVLVADPRFAQNASLFPPNVVPESQVGNNDFANTFRSAGLISRSASFGNDGTDSNSFSLVGVPNTGILTQQDCCKSPAEVKTWGGFLGNYEGHIPSFDGGCVDRPNRWCDNLSNTDRFVLEFVSKAFAAVTLQLANDGALGHTVR